MQEPSLMYTQNYIHLKSKVFPRQNNVMREYTTLQSFLYHLLEICRSQLCCLSNPIADVTLCLLRITARLPYDAIVSVADLKHVARMSMI